METITQSYICPITQCDKNHGKRKYGESMIDKYLGYMLYDLIKKNENKCFKFKIIKKEEIDSQFLDCNRYTTIIEIREVDNG